MTAQSVTQRLMAWMIGPDTGNSSMAIAAVLSKITSDPGRASHPGDPGDLGRCLRLLDLIPEWKPRMGEMAAMSEEWEALVAAWPDLEAAFREDKGGGLGVPDGPFTAAPKTAALMQDVLGPYMDRQQAASSLAQKAKALGIKHRIVRRGDELFVIEEFSGSEGELKVESIAEGRALIDARRRLLIERAENAAAENVKT